MFKKNKNKNNEKSNEEKADRRNSDSPVELSLDNLGQVFAGRKSIRGAGEATIDLEDNTRSKIWD